MNLSSTMIKKLKLRTVIKVMMIAHRGVPVIVTNLLIPVYTSLSVYIYTTHQYK